MVSSLASGRRWYVWLVRKVGFRQMRRFVGTQGSMLRVLMDSWNIGEGSAELAILAIFLKSSMGMHPVPGTRKSLELESSISGRDAFLLNR